MGSAQPDRSISSGISIPQWMKNKINDRYDIEETFSPPAHDDTFFYIRYPKSTRPRTSEPVKLVEETVVNPPQPDFSQHTDPCRQFIPSVSMNTDVKGSSVVKPVSSRVKPQDDEIAGDSGACGKSVVDVAKQMISNKSIFRGFSVAGSNDNLAVPSSGFDPAKRRGSRSLPASPLGSPSQSPTSSPRTYRKIAHPNKFFTGTFHVPEKIDASGEESSSNFGSWIWPGFLGNRDNGFAPSKALTIREEDHGGERAFDDVSAGRKDAKFVENPVSASILANKSSDSSLAPRAVSPETQRNIKLQPKPSELREMNFWSPTSM